MCISDWVADVCSSDLGLCRHARRQRREYERSQFGKPYPLLNEAGRDAETFRHILGPRALVEDVLESRALIRRVHRDEIGSATGRERVGEYASISEAAGSFKKKTNQ